MPAKFPDRQLAAVQLFSFARWYAASKGHQLGAGADGQIEWMCQETAEGIFQRFQPPVGDMDTAAQARATVEIRMAEAALSTLIDGMIEAREHVYDNLAANDRVIGEDTLAWAKNRLCPLFPIC